VAGVGEVGVIHDDVHIVDARLVGVKNPERINRFHRGRRKEDGPGQRRLSVRGGFLLFGVGFPDQLNGEFDE
jgi:hypothetical protein